MPGRREKAAPAEDPGPVELASLAGDPWIATCERCRAHLLHSGRFRLRDLALRRGRSPAHEFAHALLSLAGARLR